MWKYISSTQLQIYFLTIEFSDIFPSTQQHEIYIRTNSVPAPFWYLNCIFIPQGADYTLLLVLIRANLVAKLASKHKKALYIMSN